MDDDMVGMRVGMPAWTDEWMSGDRYGLVVRHDTVMERVTVVLDRTGREVVINAEEVTVL